jgi:hypothetical protein
VEIRKIYICIVRSDSWLCYSQYVSVKTYRQSNEQADS